MRYNCYIDIGNSGLWTAFTPDSVAPFSNNVEEGQYFKRIGWGEVKISNRPGSIYNDISNANYNTRINIRFTTANFQVDGYFGKNDCKFDYNRKILTVTPATLDKYTAFLENWENDISFDNFPFSTSLVNITIHNLDFSVKKDWSSEKQWVNGQYVSLVGRTSLLYDFYWTDPAYPGAPTRYDIYFNTNGSPNLVALSGSDYRYAFNDLYSFTLDQRIAILEGDDYGDYILTGVTIYDDDWYAVGFPRNKYRKLRCETIFKREEIQKEDVFDVDPNVPLPPSGSGWVMRQAVVINGKNGHLWTRKPFNQEYSYWNDHWVLGAEEAVNDNTTTLSKRSSNISFGGMDNDDFSRDIENPIPFRDLITYYYNNTAWELSNKSVVSTFFFNDLESELHILDGTTGINYVTNTTNYLNGLMAFFTNEIRQITSGEPNVLPKYNIKQILDDLWILFKVYWDIDDDGNLRLEHIKYADLTANPYDIINGNLQDFTLSWDFDKSRMFNRIEIDTVISYGQDFGKNYIEFDNIVSNNRNKDLKLALKTDAISTDVAGGIIESQNVDYGIMLIYVKDGAVVNREGIISKVIETNGYLSLSNLLVDFGTYEGLWEVGRINDREYEFTTMYRTLKGTELTLKGKSDHLFYTTELGIGMLESSTIDFDKENTKLNLRYRYGSNPFGDTFSLMVQKADEFVGAEDIEFDFGETGTDVFIPMSVVPTSYIYPVSTSYKTFSIYTNTDNAWTATSTVGWVTFPQGNTGTGDGALVTLVDDNTTGNARSGVIQLTSDASTKFVNVVQYATSTQAFIEIKSLQVGTALPNYVGSPAYSFIYLKNIGNQITTKDITIAWYNPSLVLVKPIETITLTINSGEVVFLSTNVTPIIQGNHKLVVDTGDKSDEYIFYVTNT